MRIAVPRSVTNGFAYVLGCADDPYNKAIASVYDSNNVYQEEGNYPVQAVGLIILRDAAARITVNAGDYLTITNAAGEQMKIYLPALNTTEDVTLYIGRDGATYYDSALTSVARAAPKAVIYMNFKPAPKTKFGVYVPVFLDFFYSDYGQESGTHWGSAGVQDYGW